MIIRKCGNEKKRTLYTWYINTLLYNCFVDNEDKKKEAVVPKSEVSVGPAVTQEVAESESGSVADSSAVVESGEIEDASEATNVKDTESGQIDDDSDDDDNIQITIGDIKTGPAAAQ